MDPKKTGRMDEAIHPKPKSSTPAPAGSLRAITRAWIEHLRKDGHTPSTVRTYERAMDLACEFFGADGEVPAVLCAKELESFNESRLVTQKKNGKPKAKPSIAQTRRALRMALEWAAKIAG